MTAYALSPDEGSAAQVLVTNGTTYEISTVTGPGGTTTVAVSKTKDGKTQVVPVRILDTVATHVITETDVIIERTTVVVTDVRTETVTDVETLFVTVTNTETVVVTETVTVPPPP